MVGKVTQQVQIYRNQGNGSKHAEASKTLQGIIVMTGGLPKIIVFFVMESIFVRKKTRYRIAGESVSSSSFLVEVVEAII